MEFFMLSMVCYFFSVTSFGLFIGLDERWMKRNSYEARLVGYFTISVITFIVGTLLQLQNVTF